MRYLRHLALCFTSYTLNQEVRAMPAAVAQGRSNFRPQKAPSKRSMNSVPCPIYKQPGHTDFGNYLSACRLLPEGDKKFMVCACALQIVDEIDPLVQEYNDLHIDSNIVNSPAPNAQPLVARRLAIEQSPFVDFFYKHNPNCITLDSRATGNLIHTSFARCISIPIKKTRCPPCQSNGLLWSMALPMHQSECQWQGLHPQLDPSPLDCSTQ